MSFPVSGLIDMIAPTYVTRYKDGTYRSVSGESYIMLVQYSNSDVQIETVFHMEIQMTLKSTLYGPDATIHR